MPRWFYACDKKKCGPLTSAELKARVEAGQIQMTDMVLREGEQRWTSVSSVVEFLRKAADTSPPRSERGLLRFIIELGKVPLVAGRQIGEETFAQSSRFVSYVRGEWRSRFLRIAAENANLAFGDRLYQLGFAHPETIERLAALAPSGEGVQAAKRQSTTNKVQRRNLLLELASPFLAVNSLPTGAEVEYARAREAQQAWTKQRLVMANARAALWPSDWSGRGKVGLGYTAAVALISAFLFAVFPQTDGRGDRNLEYAKVVTNPPLLHETDVSDVAPTSKGQRFSDKSPADSTDTSSGIQKAAEKADRERREAQELADQEMKERAKRKAAEKRLTGRAEKKSDEERVKAINSFKFMEVGFATTAESLNKFHPSARSAEPDAAAGETVFRIFPENTGSAAFRFLDQKMWDIEIKYDPRTVNLLGGHTVLLDKLRDEFGKEDETYHNNRPGLLNDPDPSIITRWKIHGANTKWIVEVVVSSKDLIASFNGDQKEVSIQLWNSELASEKFARIKKQPNVSQTLPSNVQTKAYNEGYSVGFRIARELRENLKARGIGDIEIPGLVLAAARSDAVARDAIVHCVYPARTFERAQWATGYIDGLGAGSRP